MTNNKKLTDKESMCNKNKGNTTKGRNSKKSSSRRKSHIPKDTATSTPDLSKSTNEAAWYNKIPGLLDSNSNLAFNSILGNSASIGSRTQLGRTVESMNISQPGIMQIELLPTIGSGYGEQLKPIDIAGTKLWAKFRQKLSGSTRPYDAADLMIFTICAADILSALKWLKRAYGVANQYYVRNKFMPKAVLNAMGFSDDIIPNIAQFRADINNLISQASTICMPKELTYFSRTAFLYDNIYCESELATDQLYVTKPAAFRKYVLDAETGSSISYVRISGAISYHTAIEVVRDMIQSLLFSEDYGTVAGDYIKVYEEAGLLYEDYLTEDYKSPVVVDPVFLEQIKNITLLNNFCFNLIKDMKVTQDPTYGTLTENVFKKFETQDVTTYNYPDLVSLALDKRIYTDATNVTPELLVELTRFVVGNDNFTTWVYGTEVVYNVNLYYMDLDVEDPQTSLKVTTLLPSLNVGMNTSATATQQWDNATWLSYWKTKNLLCAFHYRPCQRVFDTTDAVNMKAVLLPDDRAVSNYGIVSFHNLRDIHETALMNLFYLE